MDSTQPWVSSSSRSPTNLDYRRIFDAYLYEYLLKRNMLTSADIFKQEAQIKDIRSILTDSPGDFLFDWWAIFYDSHTARQNGLQGNQAPLSSQFGQGSSSCNLPPLPPFPRDPGPMPQFDCTDYGSQAWLTPDNSPLICRTNGIPQVCSAPNSSSLVTGAGDIPSAWQALGSAVATATEEAPLLYVDPNLSSQSPAPSTAVVLTPRNLTSVSPTQFTQRGMRRGSSPSDPIDVETPMASSSSAPVGTSSMSRGRRPCRPNQPLSRGSSVVGANWMPSPSFRAPPVSSSISQAWMAGQTTNYSRCNPFPDIGAHSVLSLMTNFNAVSGSMVLSSRGMADQVESYGPHLSNSQAMLASTSNRISEARNAANDQNSKTSIIRTLGLYAAGTPAAMKGSSSTQKTAYEESSDGMKPETAGQPSTPAIASNPHTDPKMENNEEVSSAMKVSHMKEADEDGEQHKENDKNLKEKLSENKGFENEIDASIVAIVPQPRPEASQLQLQLQPSQLIEVRDEGFEFKQEACLESNLAELWCCQFSSSGKYLACAGIDRKVIVWNMGTFVCTASEEHHDEAVVDIRFKPNSCIFASASLDKTIRIWDAEKPEKALVHLTGHPANVTSLDFHPTNFDLLCSSDGNQEIRFWNISNGTCLFAIKDASQKVRFQTQEGNYLAAAAGNTINILDSETLTIMHTLKGHIRPVECLCWDSSGRYLASASQESVHIWSVSNWCNCTHKLTAERGSMFKSCIFHPGISHVVIIGSDKNIEIWNPMDNGKTLAVPAHESYVAGLTSSICTDIIASASHDGRVKLWRC